MDAPTWETTPWGLACRARPVEDDEEGGQPERRLDRDVDRAGDCRPDGPQLCPTTDELEAAQAAVRLANALKALSQGAGGGKGSP